MFLNNTRLFILYLTVNLLLIMVTKASVQPSNDHKIKRKNYRERKKDRLWSNSFKRKILLQKSVHWLLSTSKTVSSVEILLWLIVLLSKMVRMSFPLSIISCKQFHSMSSFTLMIGTQLITYPSIRILTNVDSIY